MYLKPLWKIYLDNKSIYGNSTLYLLVDIKTTAIKTYKLLEDIFNKYKPMLTHVSLDSLYIGPVTIILSGNRPPINHFDDYQYRNVLIDGSINDIGIKIFEEDNAPTIWLHSQSTLGIYDYNMNERRVQMLHKMISDL